MGTFRGVADAEQPAYCPLYMGKASRRGLIRRARPSRLRALLSRDARRHEPCLRTDTYPPLISSRPSSGLACALRASWRTRGSAGLPAEAATCHRSERFALRTCLSPGLCGGRWLGLYSRPAFGNERQQCFLLLPHGSGRGLIVSNSFLRTRATDPKSTVLDMRAMPKAEYAAPPRASAGPVRGSGLW